MNHSQIISALQFVIDVTWAPLFLCAVCAVIRFGAAVFGPHDK